MYLNWGQQGVPKGQLFSQEQGRAPASTGQVPQQLDGSLYGTPVANTQGSLNRHAHFQGLSNNHGDSVFKAVDHQSLKPPMQSSAFNTSFMGEQGFGRQNLFEQAPIQEFKNENDVHNYQLAGNYNNNVSFQEFNGRQERGGLFGLMQDEATQISPTQSSATLDPLEQKILFGTNDNDWDPSFGGGTDLGMGSWSALMQSAVAETSSSDAVQHAGYTEKSNMTGNDSNVFPGFQQPSFQVLSERNNAPESSSHVSGQRSSKTGGNWLSSNNQQTPSMEVSQRVQRFGSLEKGWPGSDNDAHHQSVSGIEASRQVPKTSHVDYMKNVDTNTIHMRSDSGGNDHRELCNGPRGMDKSDHVGAGAYEKQPNGFQRDVSNPFQHTTTTNNSREYLSSNARDYLSAAPTHQELHKQGSEGIPSYGHGYFGQANTFHNVSNSPMNFEKGHLPEFQGNSKASEDMLSRGRLGSNISNSVDRSIGHNIQSLKAETSDPDTQQLYNQPSVGLRLAPPSERMANQNFFQYPQSSLQMGITSNQRHVNQELGENNPPWMAAPSAQSLSPSERAVKTEHRDGKLSRSGQVGVRNSQLNMQGTSPGQIQRQHGANAPSQFQSFQAFSGPSSRFLPSNLAPPQDTSRQTNDSTCTQELPVLEAVSVTQPSILSSMSEQGEDSVKPHNIWTKIPTHRLSSNEGSPKVHSTDSLNNSLENTSFASEAQNEQNSHLDGIEVSQNRASLRDHQGMDYGRGKPSMRTQLQKSSKIQDATSHIGTLQGQQSVPTHLQNFNRVWHGDKQAPASATLEAYAHYLQKSDVNNQNEFLLQQAQAIRNAEIYQGASTNGANLDAQVVNVMTGQQSFNGQTITVQNHMGNELNAISHFQPGNSGNFFSGATVNNTTHTLSSQPTLNNNSPHMALSPFQQYGNIINGQMLSLSDPRAANNASLQLEKSSIVAHAHTSDLQVNSAMAGQIGSVWPNAASSLVVDEPSPTPFMSTSDKIDQTLVVTRLKKRKTATSELLPWHQEITQNSHRLHNLSVAQIEWVQATNRLTEKVEYKDVVIEDGNPLIRPKKRLLLTTQLIQQLMRPPPAALFSADAASAFDCVAYCVAKLTLGDACSMATCKRSDHLHSQDKSNTTLEKQSASERVGGHFLSKAIEGFTGRAKKLENDFLRLDKKASMVDLLVDCQDLDKFSVINRFAKFHVRAPVDNTDNSSNAIRNAAASRMLLQRYVTALPMPSRLPDGVNCLSL